MHERFTSVYLYKRPFDQNTKALKSVSWHSIVKAQ